MPSLSSADHHASPPTVIVPRDYNAAHDLIERNLIAGRAAKIAYVDDAGRYTYGQLAERVNRAAGALTGIGLAMEERVMLCHLDTVDWPSVFLGAIKAGIVPVAVNTLLTTSDYEFMLRDSRARALIVSEALYPSFAPLIGKLPLLKHVIVSGGNAQGHLSLQDLMARAGKTCETAPSSRGRAADPAVGVQTSQGAAADRLLRGADALRGAARQPRAAEEGGTRPSRVHLGGRGAAGGHRRALDPAFRRRGAGRNRFHRASAHLPLQPAGRGSLRHHRQARTGIPDQARRRGRDGSRPRRNRRVADQRADGSRLLLEQPRKDAGDFRRCLDARRRQVQRRQGRLLHLRGPFRRHAESERHLRFALRSRGGARDPSRRARGGGGRGT